MGGLESGRGELATSLLLRTAKDAAEVLRVGRTTLYALMKAGELRPSASATAAGCPASRSSGTYAAWEPRAGAPAIEGASGRP